MEPSKSRLRSAGSAALAILLASLAWTAGDRTVGAAGDPATPSIEQKGHAAPRSPGTEGHDRQLLAHAELTAERPARADERPLTIRVSDKERAALGVSEPGTRKLRVGAVKAVNAHVRFDDLQPRDLRGRRVREHGVMQGTDDGGFVWTAVLRSEGAAALRARVNGFFLPPGAELWIYTAAGEAYGPYTWAGPNGTREFWTHSVSGSEAFLQLRARGPVTRGDLRRLGFVIADVAHVDDAAMRGPSRPDAAPAVDGFCQFNAWCVVSGECAGSEWNNVRNAVAHIRFTSGPWVYICSGGLVADSSASGTPYFITANHCISRDREATSMEAFFRFRSTTCGTQTCGSPSSVPRTLGSTILSTSSTSDYTLLRLSQSAPTGSYFLGWTSTPVASTNNAQLFRFSHPKGSPQAYSAHAVDTSKPTCTSWPRGPWIYSRDTEGATEGGSSGSPVVNAEGQLVGQLSGACGYNVNDSCDSAQNATVDGAFANYYTAVSQYLGPASSNQPPTASFTVECSGLTCSFDGTSSADGDGSIQSYAWAFGDGSSGTGSQTQHTYGTDGTFSVTLTVTDNDGATGTSTETVTVSAAEPPPGGIEFSASGYKVKGLQKADLKWSGASTEVTITRNGATIASGLSATGTLTDNIDRRGGGSYTYEVCETGTTVCAQATVTF